MHAEAMEFVSRTLIGKKFSNVVEIGSRNINGSVRGLFSGKAGESYWGIDLYDGPDVDEVADAVDWRPEGKVDCVICCEVLEHAPDVNGILKMVSESLSAGGWFIMTCAGPGRKPHSSIDGGPVRPHEHYANVAPAGFQELCEINGLYIDQIEHHEGRGDLYAVAQKR